MKRTPIKRGKPIARTTRVKARNPKRKAAEFARCYGSPERVAFVQHQPCVNCGHTPSENAHVTTGGAGRKADACRIAPLCHTCHVSLHRVGIKTFEQLNGLDLDYEAALTDARWAVHVATAHQKQEKKP